MLRNHRGMSLMRRVKAVFWWCHMHSGDSRTATEKLATMPTDADIDLLYRTYSASPKRDDGGPEWATGPCGRSSTTGTPIRSGLTDGREQVFRRDTLFVL